MWIHGNGLLLYCSSALVFVLGNKTPHVSVDLIGEKNQVEIKWSVFFIVISYILERNHNNDHGVCNTQRGQSVSCSDSFRKFSLRIGFFFPVWIWKKPGQCFLWHLVCWIRTAYKADNANHYASERQRETWRIRIRRGGSILRSSRKRHASRPLLLPAIQNDAV